MSSVSEDLFGTYTHKLDPKNRIAIPSEWRPSEGCSLLLLSGKRLGAATVKVYTKDRFLQIVEKIRTADGFTEAQIDMYIGRLYANCVEAIINGQGKLLIPKGMCDHASLGVTVQLAGRGGYFELWDPAEYERVSALEEDSVAKINNSFGIL